MLGIDLVLDMDAGDALLDVAAGEVIGIGHRLAQRIGIGDQRNRHGLSDTGGLLDLLNLTVNAIVRHGIVKRGAGMAAQIGRGKADVFDDASGQRRKAVTRDEMLALVDQRAQCCPGSRHVTLL